MINHVTLENTYGQLTKAGKYRLLFGRPVDGKVDIFTGPSRTAVRHVATLDTDDGVIREAVPAGENVYVSYRVAA